MPDDTTARSSPPDWLAQLRTDGFCVVPNVIPLDFCAKFRDEALDWLESTGLGFDRSDRATWTVDKLPNDGRGRGIFRYHGVPHDRFMWDVRTQPGIKEVFAKVWDTPELIVSFDNLNVTFPVNAETGRTDIEPTEAWPHMDQNPHLVHELQAVQGIANLAPSGPNDGGLVVVRGSHLLHANHFDATGGIRKDHPPGRGGYSFKREDVEWYTSHGGEVVKVCAGEGDLILWDSRTIHWNSSPLASQTRFATYVAFVPRSTVSDEIIKGRLEMFRARVSAGHVPGRVAEIPVENSRGDKETRPRQEPVETPEVLRIIGVAA